MALDRFNRPIQFNTKDHVQLIKLPSYFVEHSKCNQFFSFFSYAKLHQSKQKIKKIKIETAISRCQLAHWWYADVCGSHTPQPLTAHIVFAHFFFSFFSSILSQRLFISTFFLLLLLLNTYRVQLPQWIYARIQRLVDNYSKNKKPDDFHQRSNEKTN